MKNLTLIFPLPFFSLEGNFEEALQLFSKITTELDSDDLIKRGELEYNLQKPGFILSFINVSEILIVFSGKSIIPDGFLRRHSRKTSPTLPPSTGLAESTARTRIMCAPLNASKSVCV